MAEFDRYSKVAAIQTLHLTLSFIPVSIISVLFLSRWPKMYYILGLAVLTFVPPLGTVASPSFVFSRAVSPDNSCGTTSNGGSPSGYTCPTDLPCCSTYGWCGSTDAYCLTSKGCQGQFGTCTQDGNPPMDTGDGDDGESGNDQCGPANGNAVCAVNECCSAAG